MIQRSFPCPEDEMEAALLTSAMTSAMSAASAKSPPSRAMKPPGSRRQQLTALDASEIFAMRCSQPSTPHPTPSTLNPQT